jgi:hypothetical protein
MKCALYNWQIHQIDVVGADLNGTLDEEVYMQQPTSFETGNPKFQVWKLHKSLYGLKQAGREWHSVLTTFLQQVGFNGTVMNVEFIQQQLNGHSVDIAITLKIFLFVPAALI